jgi:hypothetical protein
MGSENCHGGERFSLRQWGRQSRFGTFPLGDFDAAPVEAQRMRVENPAQV